MAANPSYTPGVYREQGGSRMVVKSGASLDIESGGELDIESGGSLKLAGTAVAATAAELTRAADVSARLVAAGATESATEADHDGRIILWDTAAGSVVTLPAATGSGARIRCMVSVLATSNSHIVKVANASDIIQGAILTVDSDTAGTVRAWVTAADSDTITLNRSTTGSVTRGEWVELVDAAANLWLVSGVLSGTGDGATPFSAGV